MTLHRRDDCEHRSISADLGMLADFDVDPRKESPVRVDGDFNRAPGSQEAIRSLIAPEGVRRSVCNSAAVHHRAEVRSELIRLDLRRHTVVPQRDSGAADSCPARNYPLRGMSQSGARDQAGGNDPPHLRSRANTSAVRAEMSKRGGTTDERDPA
jgi:hypothetical protein